MQLKLSMKDKKEDILSAYEKLLTRYQEKEKLANRAEKETEARKVAEEELLQKTSSLSIEEIVKHLTDFRMSIGKTLTNLGDNLSAEVGKLHEVQTAIEIEKKNLEEIYDIKVAAETVANLIRNHDEEKERFEEEMAAKKKARQDEQKEHDLFIKERDEKINKERKREEEEYAYALAQKRKKEKDTYEEEKAALKKALREEKESQEKALEEREKAVAARETELVELRAKVEAFPAELEKAVAGAKKEAIVQTEKEAKHKSELIAKEYEGQANVAELKIKNLEETVIRQAEQIKTLTQQISSATTNVKSIAEKAIEGASGLKALSAVNEIALQQAKKFGDKES